MLEARNFLENLRELGVGFFTGVPDSLLKDLNSCILDCIDDRNHIIAANEGGAIALASGYHIATAKIPLVYLQNSGLGNTINPLLSLADPEVYSIPMILLIGWRGEPGVKDEPQHCKQGAVTKETLEAIGVSYEVLTESPGDMLSQLKRVIDQSKKNQSPMALLVRKGSFAKYAPTRNLGNKLQISRESAIKAIVESSPENAIFVSTTGKASRELFEVRKSLGQKHDSDFLTVGSMGHASQIALSIALQKKDRVVICLDGDGSLLMHMGGAALVSSLQPTNFYHIILNNGVHESVGGQPTCAFNLDLSKLSSAFGYERFKQIETPEKIREVLPNLFSSSGPYMLEIRLNSSSRSDLGRPTSKPLENKLALMKNLQA